MDQKDKIKWQENVIHSMEHSQRALPSTDLFQKIQCRLKDQNIIHLDTWKMSLLVAATVALLITNIMAINLLKYNLNTETDGLEEIYSYSLISNFEV